MREDQIEYVCTQASPTNIDVTTSYTSPLKKENPIIHPSFLQIYQK